MAIGSPQWMYSSGADAYELDQSLKFNDDDEAHLSFTPASAGNRKTWTFSTWVKRSTLGSNQALIGDRESSDNGESVIFFNTSNQLEWIWFNGGYSHGTSLKSNAIYRDTSAWLHIMCVQDTTQGTDTNRQKIYVNGSLISLTKTQHAGSGYIPEDEQPDFNSADEEIHLGAWRRTGGAIEYELDGYLAEVHFIDGSAKAPADFGETGDYGEWKPIEYSGSYGTNGFYLPFKNDYTVEGFSTVTYAGTSVAGTYIGGVGFQSDLTWVKNRSSSGENHSLYDAVRGGGKTLYPNLTAAENSSNLLTFTTDGFTQNTTNNVASGNNYVAWNWDMGGSNASNSNGSITSTVRANTTYGQSIVSYTGNATAGATVGHGLSSTPELVITKLRSTTGHWLVNHSSFNGDEYLVLSLNEAKGDTGTEYWNGTMPNSTVFTLGAGATNNANSETHIAYCFHSVTGYSKIGSYTGNGSTTGASVTTGFKVGFLLTKCVDSATGWAIVDNTRTPTNPVEGTLYPDKSDAEYTGDQHHIDLNDNGFQIKNNNSRFNTNGETYIYMAFADKREYAYWLDQSGNNNDWTSNNLTESDISVDSPTNNFSTFNPLDPQGTTGITFSEGNLKVVQAASWTGAVNNVLMTSGKWYWEYSGTDMSNSGVGVIKPFAAMYNSMNVANGGYFGGGDRGYGINFQFGNAGDFFSNTTKTTDDYLSAYSNGDVIGVAYDADTGKIWIAKNNTWGTTSGGLGNPSTAANPAATVANPEEGYYAGFVLENCTIVANFGQDSSFAGNKTAQGNQDGNDIGDFYYTPPTGFLALCTKNLPDVAVTPSEHFNTVLYTGTGSSQSVDIGFQTDFVWNRKRNDATNFYLQDVVRGFGASKSLSSNTASQEGYDGNPSSQSLSVGSSAITVNGSDLNENNLNFVSWNWKANGSGSSNTDGSITSTVSANTDAGFSIVKWAGNGNSTATIGHGLSKAPELIIEKGLNIANNWGVAQFNDNNYKALILNSSSAWDTGNTYWNSTSPTSTVFSVDNTGGEMNYSGKDYITYCFHSVDGYSKVGSYVSNSNNDGPFIYTGFKPAFVMCKSSSYSNSETFWVMHDNKRPGYNVTNLQLYANSSLQEAQREDGGGSNNTKIDFLSNGFKWRDSTWSSNANTGNTYIYIAFAETPFKYSNAR